MPTFNHCSRECHRSRYWRLSRSHGEDLRDSAQWPNPHRNLRNSRSLACEFKEGKLDQDDASPISSGVQGLDYILRGGYAKFRSHLIEGRPGSGKTTLGLQFLIEGVSHGEKCLYITLLESKRELLSVANKHGWNLDGIVILELVPPELSLDPSQLQTLVHSSDLELGETVHAALAEVERLKPDRVVFDSLSEIRLLSQARCVIADRFWRSKAY